MTSPELSVQLYTVREALAADLPGTLAKLAAAGLNNVEVFSVDENAAAMRDAAQAAGLTIRSGHEYFLSDHVSSPTRSFEVRPVEQTLDYAAEMGLDYLIDAYVPVTRWASRDEIEKTAERLNNAVEIAASRGIRLGYHNHSHEFHNEIDGTSAYEIFAGLVDERVGLEVDVFWAATGGQDVPALLQRLGSKVRALHAKDGIIGEDPYRAEDRSKVDLDQRIAGQGELPLTEILASAAAAELVVIEFDRYNGDIFDAIEKSAAWLREAGVR
ncbi:sugar phosphate isomerase/epimerase [Microbacterium sp. NC79]|uniref:sugar phosphate isomerase/epimerase family protein n=1 Tax=Microbacterium sp. NC79 TaxID=2851009 RepID=UPI001C2CBDE2|nr:sugar phosphate isomerase/epimerase [Microbacterium sp. NC79]MBV0895957.1 sugar phosphate isomerase/epimerase [Microbacterium sp. NC79]